MSPHKDDIYMLLLKNFTKYSLRFCVVLPHIVFQYLLEDVALEPKRLNKIPVVEKLGSFLRQFPLFPNAFLVGGAEDFFIIELAVQLQKLKVEPAHKTSPVAVNENLKADQMIKKVIVFTDDLEPSDSQFWDVQYDALRSYFEEIRSKFRDKGYGDDAVPHILYLNENEHPWICTQHPGFTIMSGFSHNIYQYVQVLEKWWGIWPAPSHGSIHRPQRV
ncbi:hypothetical protein Pyn_31155 [Prunus yedoensis var. nudiflora]|uniref:DUF7788 domain-containing protein n=1 Tax=Prunus yedoensis var. nudiflora TaxID=2094558 RepID=A0A314XN88_PRUYE|nr:hypothetical protein Pyn_31155 [Prunus yedoensis var. nudiflora]